MNWRKKEQRTPHLIKPPWKKQKDKTQRIRTTCGSILWLINLPPSRAGLRTCWGVGGKKKKKEKIVYGGERNAKISASTCEPQKGADRRGLSPSLTAIRARAFGGNLSAAFHRRIGAARTSTVAGWTCALERTTRASLAVFN